MTLTRAALAAGSFSALLALPLHAGEHHRSGSLSISSGDAQRIASCDAVRMTFDDAETLRGEQVIELAGSELAIEAPENGGVRIQGSERKGIHVLVCKAVADGGAAALAAVGASVEKERLVVRGPEADRWAVHLVVDVPRDARISVSAENGPVSLLEVAGSVRVDTVNGPVSALRSEGSLTISAANGPVSVVDASGDVKLDVENGPISVKLAPGAWRGAGLDASTQNGPLSLRVPEAYDSGVEVRMSKRSPLSCSAGPCDGARRETLGGTRTVSLGSGATAVRLSTVNGPVAIKTRS
jgi:hypothetical protein